MTSAILKITSTLLIVACVVQAAPVAERNCVGDACNQSVQSGKVNLGSTTNVVPVTQVVPITRYQPVGPGEDMTMMLPYNRFHYNMDRFDRYDRMHGFNFNPRFNRGDMDFDSISRNRFNLGNVNVNHFSKRDSMKSDEDQMDMHNVKDDCVPSATESCEQSLPISRTDMGSYVSVKPSNVILPSTVYHGRVQSKAADVDAAPAQHSSLSRQHVSLGSNTMIQPMTKVLPQTTYQPSVSQKATTIEAAGLSDLSLARSSVSLGSSVTIRPTTTVEPLTIFQPSIQSLPFVITDEGCA
ncbi:hypothetical protein BGX26_002281 [Mortierella sp. AD094]|nr:hypothetical protein BGX26_002281 [Mortierella sp. AD094]